jgi:enoyl-CoA hydratase/carnithine racemase
MTGATISAADAHRHGLVNHLCEPPKLLQCVEEVAAQIAANSPFAVRLAKLAARSGVDRPLEEGLAIEAAAYRRTLRHPDRLEGVSAFIQRRTPEFSDE